MNSMRFAALLLLILATVFARAEPVVPTRDDQVVEVLPAAAADRSEERRLRREWSANPRDVARSVALAKRYLDQAHEIGDPRYAGQALAVLQAWPDADKAPDDVLLMTATIQQYLHEFDTAAAHLERLVARQPQNAQAWLTLATVRRVQGRYPASDTACAGVAAAGASLYAAACRVENDGLRGDFDGARTRLNRLLATPRLPASTQNWLLTTLAELEARAGAPEAAEAAYVAALKASADGYTTLSFVDFLLFRDRDADALLQLASQPRTDEILLRLAIAGTRAGTAQGRRDAREVRDRTSLANLRPEARTTHAREAAMVAMWLDRQPAEALKLARLDVQHQREPLDLLLLATIAKQARQTDGLREADRVRKDMGLVDRRLDALLD